MTRPGAIILAVFTVWPLLYIVLFMALVVSLMLSVAVNGAHTEGPPLVFLILVPLHLLTMLDLVVLLVTYLMHLFRTDRVPQDKKALWAVVLFVGNLIAMPFYWYFYIWSDPKIQASGERP